MKKKTQFPLEIRNTNKSTKPFVLRIIPYVLLVVISLLPLLSFFHQGLPITHDGKDHVARIANFYQALQDGVLFPRWAENLNWGYGHPILMFLYPLPSYVASFFHFFGLSFIDSVKTVFVLAYILSGVTMYLWVSSFLNKNAGFIAAILYLYAPYRFVDLQVRGAFGEHVAFIFPPLVLYFLFKLFQKKDILTLSLGALSLAGLLLSHNAISIMFIPLFVTYGIFLLEQAKEKKVFFAYSLLLVILGFMLAAFFWVPALLEGKYTLRDIVTSSEYQTRFVPFQDFLYGSWSFGGTDLLSKQIGVLQWALLVATVFIGGIWYKKKDSLWQLAFGSLTIFAFSLFFMTSASEVIWNHIKILQDFQFPWRFLTVSVFITAFCGGLVTYSLPKRLQIYAIGIITLAAIVLNSGYWGVNGYLYKSDSFFSGIYEGTTDTGESAPIWSVRFMEKRPKAHIETITGKTSITEVLRKTNEHTYLIEASEKSRLRENTLYFPGWEVRIDNMPMQIEFQDPKNRGLITFFVEKGSHSVQIIFKETKIRLVADIISLFSLVIVGIFCIMKVGLLWKRSL
jgi:uncharacterized membrane protein